MGSRDDCTYEKLLLSSRQNNSQLLREAYNVKAKLKATYVFFATNINMYVKNVYNRYICTLLMFRLFYAIAQIIGADGGCTNPQRERFRVPALRYTINA